VPARSASDSKAARCRHPLYPETRLQQRAPPRCLSPVNVGTLNEFEASHCQCETCASAASLGRFSGTIPATASSIGAHRPCPRLQRLGAPKIVAAGGEGVVVTEKKSPKSPAAKA
jgi:hypothetical protein